MTKSKEIEHNPGSNFPRDPFTMKKLERVKDEVETTE